MELSKWDPFRELTSLRRQVDRLIESFFGREPLIFGREKWTPAIDIAETADEISVKIELAGIEEKDKYFHRMERHYGSLERVITLPVLLGSESVKAEYKKGVIENPPKEAE